MNESVKNICCIGAGYVGGPTMAVFADKCPHLNFNVVDINEQRVNAWNNNNLDKLPVYEKGLKDIIMRCRGRNLHFSTDVENNIAIADMIFISVNTPIKKYGVGAGHASDLKWVESSARQILKYAKGYTIVVEKSTLPVKTAEMIKIILNDGKSKDKEFAVLSNPEFLAEGTAINDLENPDRVLIGGEDDYAINLLVDIYTNWIEPNRILKTNLWSSELSKLTANAFLAQRISSINSISALCEKTGAKISEVALAIGTDSRIGNKFLSAGPGFGGSCFKKDILNLVYISRFYGLEEVARFWENVVGINNWQQTRISELIVRKLFGTISDKNIAVLGYAFKANTNDTRESPAIRICQDLINEGASLNIYDPKVNSDQIYNSLKENQKDFCLENKNINVNKNIEEACINVDAIILLTEWEEFRKINWKKIALLTRKPTWLFDTRNFSNYKDAKKYGIKVWALGTGEIL